MSRHAIQGLNFTTFKKYFKILYFVSKGSLNIPEYRCLVICRVLYLYTIEPAVKNIAYFRFQLISVTLSLLAPFLCINWCIFKNTKCQYFFPGKVFFFHKPFLGPCDVPVSKNWYKTVSKLYHNVDISDFLYDS